MNGAAFAGMVVLGAVGMGLNFWFWWLAVTRWNERFRQRCERRYGVTIALRGRGAWHVVGGGPWYRRLGIEMLQLAYFMGVILGWGLVVTGVMILIALLSR